MFENIDNLTNVTSYDTLFYEFGVSSGGLFGSLILLSLFVIVLAVGLRFSAFKNVLIFDGFITSLLGVYLLVMGIVGWAVVIVPILIFLAALLYAMFSDE